jgi:hypothetical protein
MGILATILKHIYEKKLGICMGNSTRYLWFLLAMSMGAARAGIN